MGLNIRIEAERELERRIAHAEFEVRMGTPARLASLDLFENYVDACERGSLLEDAEKELEDAEKELEDEREALAEVEKKLEDAGERIARYSDDATNARAELEEARDEIKALQADLDAVREELRIMRARALEAEARSCDS